MFELLNRSSRLSAISIDTESFLRHSTPSTEALPSNSSPHRVSTCSTAPQYGSLPRNNSTCHLSAPSLSSLSSYSRKHRFSSSSTAPLLSPRSITPTLSISRSHLPDYSSYNRSISMVSDYCLMANGKAMQFDPEMVYAVCFASRQVSKNNFKKNRFAILTTRLKNMFLGKNKSKKETSNPTTRDDREELRGETKDIEYDLICNCPLLWRTGSNGRRYSVSERHKYDRLLVLNACRKYGQLQNISNSF